MIAFRRYDRYNMKVHLTVSLSLLAICGILSYGCATHAQEERILVESSVDRSTITVGDPITYTLTITRAESVVVRPPEMGVNLGQFEIRDYEVVDPQKTEAGLITDSYSYVISVYDVGEFEIPPVSIFYTDLAGQPRSIRSQAITITVNSVKPSEAEDIKDIKPPVEITGTRNIYLWGAGALALLIGVLILLYLWKRRKARGETEEERHGPPRPAHEIAYEELDRIERLNLIDQGMIKEYYTEVSEVIRRYVGHRYRIITMELTTAELVDSMVEDDIEEGRVGAVRSFLEECDLVKFAKFIPPLEEMEAALSKARTIVDATKETLLGPVEGPTVDDEEKKPEPIAAEPVSADAEPSTPEGT